MAFTYLLLHLQAPYSLAKIICFQKPTILLLFVSLFFSIFHPPDCELLKDTEQQVLLFQIHSPQSSTGLHAEQMLNICFLILLKTKRIKIPHKINLKISKQNLLNNQLTSSAQNWLTALKSSFQFHINSDDQHQIQLDP